MEKIIVVSSPGCPICMQVKMMLKNKGVSFEECDISSELGKSIADESQMRSLPILKLDGNFFCGSSALSKVKMINKQ